MHGVYDLASDRTEAASLPGARELTIDDVRDMALGASFLGSGGGGSPRAVLLQLEAVLAAGQGISLIDLTAVPDDALIAPCGWMGAPTVSDEKLPNGSEAARGLYRLEQAKNQRVFAVCPIEIGGSNGLSPLLLAAQCGLPVVDCDGMGRAFPESQMVIFNVQGCTANPAIVTDDKGNTLVFDAASNAEEERILRVMSIAMGGACHVIDYAGSGYQMKQHAVRGTVSLAISIGRALRVARRAGHDPFQALIGCLRDSSYYCHGGVLVDGKVVDLERATTGGFAVGRCVLEAFGSSERTVIEFQNENLVARRDSAVIASVPDILTFLDRETAEPVATEQLRYGQRLKLVGVSVPPILRSERALAVFGPQAFGIPEPYRPIESIQGWSHDRSLLLAPARA